MTNENLNIEVCGIYGLRCKTTGKWYIGQSTNIHKRWKTCYKTMSCPKQRKIFNALKKYGYDDFDKIVIEECSKNACEIREPHWIEFYNAVNDGYNLRTGGRSGGKLSEETRKKMSLAKLGKKRKPHSKKTRKRISDSCRLAPMPPRTPEHNAKLVESRKRNLLKRKLITN